jgi:hypothetical protein
MGERDRIGQRHIKALRPGQVVWDSAVIGFGARRQRSEASAILYSTVQRKGGNAGRLSAGTARHGCPTPRGMKRGDC